MLCIFNFRAFNSERKTYERTSACHRLIVREPAVLGYLCAEDRQNAAVRKTSLNIFLCGMSILEVSITSSWARMLLCFQVDGKHVGCFCCPGIRSVLQNPLEVWVSFSVLSQIRSSVAAWCTTVGCLSKFQPLESRTLRTTEQWKCHKVPGLRVSLPRQIVKDLLRTCVSAIESSRYSCACRSVLLTQVTACSWSLRSQSMRE